MPTFGDYETVGEPLSVMDLQGHSSTVWKARKAGAQGGDFVVKIYVPLRKSKEAGQGDSLERDRGLEFIEGVKQHKKAQMEGGSCLSSIYNFGVSPEGAWYATDFYPRGSLLALIERRAKVDDAALRQIVRCIIAGCLQLKKSRQLSHGNLKASNVYLVGKPRPLPKTPLVLGDSFPAAPLQLARLDESDKKTAGELLHQVMEAQDLHALGEIILQLVERRPVRSSYDYNYPVARSDAWDNLGKDGERWRQICNQLLDPQLSLGETNLESLARQFPTRAGGGQMLVTAGAVAAVCLIGGVIYFGVSHHKKKSAAEFTNALHSAQDALSQTNLTLALAKVNDALIRRSDDEGAKQLKSDIETRNEAEVERVTASVTQAIQNKDFDGAQSHLDWANKNLLLNSDTTSKFSQFRKTLQDEREYSVAIQASQAAYARSAYSEAAIRAEDALKIKPGDLTAGGLRDKAQKALASQTADERRQSYQAAMKLGDEKFNANDFAGAMEQADIALANEPNDKAALKLKTDAGTQQAVAESAQQRQRDYETAMKTGTDNLNAADYPGALAQADAALANKPNDKAALKLKADAKAGQDAVLADQQRQRDYDTAMKAGSDKLNAGDSAGAISQADIALAKKPNDEAALKLKADAKAQQDAAQVAQQREKDYQAAMKLGRDKLTGGDYATAIAEADAALAKKPNDDAALKLKADARAQQDAAQAAQQREKDYDTAMKLGNDKLSTADYPGAMAQADTALAKKPGDQAALKLKADAKAQQDAALAAQQREKDYEAAMKLGNDKLNAGDYPTAMSQADAALANKPNDRAALKLKADAKAQQDAVLAAQQKQKNYETAMVSGTDKFKAGDYVTAMTQADLALANKPNDPAASKLKADAKTQRDAQLAGQQKEQDYQAALQSGRTALANKQYQEATSQAAAALAKKPNDPAALKLKADVSELQTLDGQFETMLVWFNVLSAKNKYIQNADAKKQAALPSIGNARDDYLKQANQLETKYQAGGWLNENDRDKYLSALKKNIDRWE